MIIYKEKLWSHWSSWGSSRGKAVECLMGCTLQYGSGSARWWLGSEDPVSSNLRHRHHIAALLTFGTFAFANRHWIFMAGRVRPGLFVSYNSFQCRSKMADLGCRLIVLLSSMRWFMKKLPNADSSPTVDHLRVTWLQLDFIAQFY